MGSFVGDTFVCYLKPHAKSTNLPGCHHNVDSQNVNSHNVDSQLKKKLWNIKNKLKLTLLHCFKVILVMAFREMHCIIDFRHSIRCSWFLPPSPNDRIKFNQSSNKLCYIYQPPIYMKIHFKLIMQFITIYDLMRGIFSHGFS